MVSLTGSLGSFAAKLEDNGIWKDAPVLKGTTKFEPNPDTKNVLVTGGAGFMCDSPICVY